MNKSKFYILIIVLLLVSNAILIFGFLHKPKRPLHPKSPKEIISKTLSFDNKQIEKYDSIIIHHQVNINNLREGINDKRQQLYAYLTKAKNDSATALIIEDLAKLELEIEQTHYNHFQDIKSICHPDQMDDFEALCKKLHRLFGNNKPKP